MPPPASEAASRSGSTSTQSRERTGEPAAGPAARQPEQSVRSEAAIQSETPDTEHPETEHPDTEPTDTEPTNTEPTNTEPTNTEPTDTEPTDTEPPDTEASDTGPVSTLEAIIGERVRQYRHAASLSSADLAFRTGMSRAMVSRVESATTSSSLSTLQRLAEALNIPVTALFRGVDSDREAVYTPAGHGALTVRSGTRHGHRYHSLGHLRGTGETALEPTLVTLTEASMVFPLFQHPGEEFLYQLQGVMVYAHGAYRYTLSPGDSLLIDGEGPHGPLELVDLPVSFLAISQHHT